MVLFINGKRAQVGDEHKTSSGKILIIKSWTHPTRRDLMGKVFVTLDGEQKMFRPKELKGEFR